MLNQVPTFKIIDDSYIDNYIYWNIFEDLFYFVFIRVKKKKMLH